MREKDGELIILYWEDYPGYEAIKGGVDEDQAKGAIALEYGDGEVPPIKSIEHKFGRWGFGWDETGERMTRLYEYDKKARGRFPITLVHVEHKPL